MPKRELQGVVVSDKADKTVVVKVERRIVHPVYKKIMNLRQKETNKTMSLFRNFGKTPNNKKIIWNNLPDEIWREILTFTL